MANIALRLKNAIFKQMLPHLFSLIEDLEYISVGVNVDNNSYFIFHRQGSIIFHFTEFDNTGGFRQNNNTTYDDIKELDRNFSLTSGYQVIQFAKELDKKIIELEKDKIKAEKIIQKSSNYQWHYHRGLLTEKVS